LKLTLTARHLDITPHLRKHVEDKAARLEKHNSHILQGEIILFRDHVDGIAEGKVHLGHAVLAAKGQAPDMYDAVNDLFDKLLAQLERHEGKLKDRRRRTAAETE
jgi:ribosomal subunit interface protein